MLSFSKLLLSRENQVHYFNVFASLCGGARGRVTPSPIPNLEVKPPIADDTAPVWCGNVGRCHFETFLSFLPFLTITLSFNITKNTNYKHVVYLSFITD